MAKKLLDLTDVQRQIVMYVCDGRTSEEIRKELGLRRSHIDREIRAPGPVRDALDLYYADVARDHGRHCRVAVPKALNVLLKVLEDETTKEDSKIKAAKAILDHGRDWMGVDPSMRDPTSLGDTGAKLAALLRANEDAPALQSPESPLGRPGDFSQDDTEATDPTLIDTQDEGENDSNEESGPSGNTVSTAAASIL